jgi:tape measure domain-containing protein
MLVRDLLTRLRFSVDESQLKRYEHGVQNIKNAADGAADAFRNMFAGFVGLAAGKALANTADEMQSLGMLPQTVGDTGTAFDTVANRASDARQSIQAYAAFYVKAANATQDYLRNQEDVLKVVDGVAFGLAASGATAASQSQALFQLGQAIGSPTVQMEEMNTLIDVAPDLFRALGRAIPGANGNLKKFISTGRVTGQMLAEGLMQVMPQFQEQAKSMPMTLGDAWTKIANRFQIFVARMNRESSAIPSIAAFLVKGYGKVQSALERLVNFLGGATPTLKFFGIALAAALAPLVFKIAAGAVMFLISPLGLLMAGLFSVGLALEDVYTWMNDGESVIGKSIGSWENFKKIAEENIETIKIYGAVAAGIAASVAIHFAAMAAKAVFLRVKMTALWIAARVQAAITFASMVARGAAWVAATLAQLAVVAAGWITKFALMAIATIAATWPILLIVAALALVVAGLYLLWDNWSKIMGWIKESASGAWTFVSDQFMAMVEKIKGYWDSCKSFFGRGVSATLANNFAAVNPASVAAFGLPAAGGNGGNVYNEIHQTLPSGTPEQTRQAAYEGTRQALGDNSMDRFARQAAQAQ